MHLSPPPHVMEGQTKLREVFDVPIIHATYKLYLNLYSLILQFPKKDRYALGSKCEHAAIAILEQLLYANSRSGKQRLATLHEIDIKLKVLKTLIRLCYDVKVLDQKKYLAVQVFLQEIGKMLGGWIKSMNPENLRPNSTG